MSLIHYESSRAKDAEREAWREAQERLLTDAEAAYHRKQAQTQIAKERDDDRWLLPSIEENLSSNKSAKKKKKKEKKVSRPKKKKRKYRESSSGSDPSNEEIEEWVEKDAEIMAKLKSSKMKRSFPEKPREHDEWMSLPGSFLCSSRDEKQKTKENNKKAKDTCILDEPGQSTRELNPYWKDGGMGLPEQDECQLNRSPLMDAAWLKKSLHRAQEQAKEEGKSIEEIATQRWGSLDAIHSMIKEAEANSRVKYGSRTNWRMNEDPTSSHFERDYRDDKQRSHKRDNKKSRGKHRTSSPHCGERSEHEEGRRQRSRNREQMVQISNHENGGRFSDRRKKMGFMKPNETNPSSVTTSAKSSLTAKRWQKPEIKEKIVEQERDSERLAFVRERIEKSASGRSDSEPEEKGKGDAQDQKMETGVLTTEAEMNSLGAKIVKAEIIGDTELATKLKAKLEVARKARNNQLAIPRERKPVEEESIILTIINAKGMARPLEPRSLYKESSGGRRKGKTVDTHESGKRVRYFADDDKFTLQAMFQREKGQTSAENDASFIKMSSMSMDMDELFEQRITRQDSVAKQDARDRTRAIRDHKQLEKTLDNCRLCFDSKAMLKHLIVAMGAKTYVSLPSHVSLTAGHCILAPIHHVLCQTQMDEDVWGEFQNFKKALTKMFMDRKEFPVFFEMSVGQHRFPHMHVECIPLPNEVGSMAPIYFKKALVECETEWSTNKKVVDLSNRDVRQAIPKGLPYFAVNFSNHGGFAHVIEDEKLFPQNFAQEIIGGILDVDHSFWRKPQRENFDQHRRKVLEFAAMWKAYDFTTTSDD